MEDKITIIEGPPPTFEAVAEGWVLGLNESPSLGHIAVTRLRTFNGPSLVERCYRAWHHKQAIQLEFRTPEGLESVQHSGTGNDKTMAITKRDKADQH